MTINQLQAEMIVCMKQGDRERKAVISDLIAQIKKAAIDKGCRDNITEEFVNAEILKAKKIFQEMVDTCPAHRTDLLEDYNHRLDIVKEYAPSLMDDENMILYQVVTYYEGPNTKKDIMKWFNTNYRGRMDMKVAAMVADKFVKTVEG
jgi:uncharacterized protein YqeY